MGSDLVLLDDPHFIIDLMYARFDNMVGRPVYREIGYGSDAYMRPETKEALLSLIPVLEKSGQKMRIRDAYRPPLAHRLMLGIVPVGLFAATCEASNHCHGTALDVCLTDADGNDLDYPTRIDAYEERFQKQVLNGDFSQYAEHLKKAAHDCPDATEKQKGNREFLKELMETHGFTSLPYEWWHYDLTGKEKYPMIEWMPDRPFDF